MTNLFYPKPHIDIEIPHGLRDHIIVLVTVEITFNLEIESADRTCSIAKNVCRVLVKKKVLILVSKENDTINN